MDAVWHLLFWLFGLSACVLVLMVWLGGRWVRTVAVMLGLVWIYHAQWHARAYIDLRWIDDARTRYQHDAVIDAIKAGKARIALTETTNFEWAKVCRLGGYQSYHTPDGEPLREESRILREVLGTDYIPEIEGRLFGFDHFILVYATPEGPYAMSPKWSRFGRAAQEAPNGRYYREQLGGVGYWITEDFITGEKQQNQLCFAPKDAWFVIEPEPAG